MAKFVDVVKETTVTYRVDGNPTDAEAQEIVQRRIDAEAPMDIIKAKTRITKFVVRDELETS